MTPVPNADPILIESELDSYIYKYWLHNSYNGKLDINQEQYKELVKNIIELVGAK